MPVGSTMGSENGESTNEAEQQARAEGEEGEQEEGAEGPRTSQQLSASERYPPTLLLSFHCLSGAPEVETRGAPLPLTAAAASLLPASRRVPGPVAGLHHTPPLLLPPTTCGLPTPFSTSFPPRRSRSVMGEVALVLLGVVGVVWA